MVEYIGDVITGNLIVHFEATEEELSKHDCRDLERATNNALVHFHDNIVEFLREDFAEGDINRCNKALEEDYALMCAYHKEIDEWIQQMIIDYKTEANDGEYIQLVNNTLPDEYYREYIDFELIASWM